MGGYAYSGNGRGIRRVDVSCDDGKTWSEAEMDKEFVDDGRNFDWTLWKTSVRIDSTDNAVLLCRAIDSSGNSQPSDQIEIFNTRGVGANAIDRVEVSVV